MASPFEPLSFPRGPGMKNRFMLAPLTNCQSHADGTLSDAEHDWLAQRVTGGFGSVMTCAAHVQATGQGFPGQLGIFGDEHLPGLTRLADTLRGDDTLALVQLHHAGMRSPAELIGETPHCPSANEEFGARALTGAEIEATVAAFVDGAVRAERAGFHGVELHGAHGYLLCQFLSAEVNLREDDWGGSLGNRARIFFEILRGIRERCGPDFVVGVRLSPERFGMRLDEVLQVAQQLVDSGHVDFLDLSLWDCFKEPADPAFAGRSLLEWFGTVDRKDVRFGPAGKLRGPDDVRRALEEGSDFVLLGRAAILMHDFPERMRADPAFTPVAPPVSEAHLRAEGLSDPFVAYMRNWKGFVAD